jgi:hypothetical protein
MREPFDITAIAGQVRELIEGFDVALDQHREVIGRNGVFRGAKPFLEEAGDDVLAFAVEFLGLVVRRRENRRVRSGPYFTISSGPCPFGGCPGRRPSPLPPAFRKAPCFVRLQENARRSRGRSPGSRPNFCPSVRSQGHWLMRTSWATATERSPASNKRPPSSRFMRIPIQSVATVTRSPSSALWQTPHGASIAHSNCSPNAPRRSLKKGSRFPEKVFVFKATRTPTHPWRTAII